MVALTVAWLLCAAVAAQETPIDFDAAIASAEQALAALKQAKLLQEQRLHRAPPPPPPATPPLPPPKTSKDGRLLLALGVTCMPAGTQYRALSRELMARPGAAEGVAVRFVVGASARAALAAEASRHGDFLFVDCPEGGGFVKQVVAICKVVRFYAYATTDLVCEHLVCDARLPTLRELSVVALHAVRNSDAPVDVAAQIQLVALLGCDGLRTLQLRAPRAIAFPPDANADGAYLDDVDVAAAFAVAKRHFPDLARFSVVVADGRGGQTTKSAAA